MWQLNNGALCTPEFLILAGLFYLGSLPFSEQIIVLFRLLGFLCCLLFGSYSHSSQKPTLFHFQPWQHPLCITTHQRPNRFVFWRQKPSVCWGGMLISGSNSPSSHRTCQLHYVPYGRNLSVSGVTHCPRRKSLVSACPSCSTAFAWQRCPNIMLVEM